MSAAVAGPNAPWTNRLRRGAAAAALLPALSAAAQQEPEVVSPRPNLEWINFSDIHAALTTEWRRDVDDLDSPGGNDRHDRQDRLWEILELTGKGYIGHPNIIQFDLGASFWPTQRWLETDNPASSAFVGETLLSWDTSALILQQQILPVTIYTRRNTYDIDVPFGGTLENTLTQNGLRLNLRSEKFPSTVELFNLQQRQIDPFTGQQFNIDQESATANGRVELGTAQSLSWDVSYNDVKESGNLQATQSFRQLEGDVTHALNFGPEQRHELRSELTVNDQSGTSPYTQVRLFERLRLRHADKLTSWYDVVLESLDRPTLEGYTERASANVRHQLFDSLTTTARAGGDFSQIPSDDFRSNLLFGDVVTDYVKEVPLGRIDAGLTATLSRLDQTERGVPVPVTDAGFTFDPGGVIFAGVRNIEPASIVITDSTGLIVYTEGIDYTVTELPDGIEIRRLPGGNILPGQAVLVDYVIGPEPAGTTDTVGGGANFRYTFEEGILRGFSMYVRYFRQDEARSEELVTAIPGDNDFSDLLYGVEYNIWNFYLRAEQQVHDSDLSPFDATRMEIRYNQPLGPGSTVVLGALYQDLDRSSLGLRTTTTTLSGQWTQRFSERLRASLVVQWQDVDESPGFATQGLEQEFKFSWNYRQTEIYGRIRNSILNGNADDTAFQTFVVGIRRQF